MDYYLPILKRGACVQFDLIGWNREWAGIMTDDIRAHRLSSLVSQDYSSQLLLSTDTCRLSQLHYYGGRGYDYVWTHFLPLLRAQGITAYQIETILISNPSRLFTIA
jgi:phosphotriesterase-related protein